jgi:hypothetical protein
MKNEAYTERLTVGIKKSLKQALLRYCGVTNASPSAVVDRALKEFMTKTRGREKEEWFGLPGDNYLALSEEQREALWNKTYRLELDNPQPPEREAHSRVITPRQRSREALRRRLCEIRKKSASHG